MSESYDITPEMQARIREQGLEQVVLALARLTLNAQPSPDEALSEFLGTIDALVDGYSFYDQPPEVEQAGRDLMRQNLDRYLSQLKRIGR